MTISPKPRLWLCLTTSDKEFDNIAELTEDVWLNFDGICAVIHQQGGDDRVKTILNDRKKQGFVIERRYPWHHAHSKNEWLFDLRIRPLDICVIRDSCERLVPEFTRGLKSFAEDLFEHNIWNVAHDGKLLLFRRWYNQQFLFGLHWGLNGLYGTTVALEQFPQYAENNRSCAYSVRNEKRPANHRYFHELSYILDYGPNGNHLALFHPDPKDLDAAHWRLCEYTAWLAERGIATAEQLIQRWKFEYRVDVRISQQERDWINAERPFRNAYRWFVLEHTDAAIKADEDTWRLT